MSTRDFRLSSAAQDVRARRRACWGVVALFAAAGCSTDAGTPQLAPAGRTGDAPGATGSPSATASSPGAASPAPQDGSDDAGAFDAGAPSDAGGAQAPAPCPQESTPYDVGAPELALTGQGCKLAVRVEGDEVDVYLPRLDRPSPALVVMQGAKVDKAFYSRFAEQVSAYGVVVAVANHDSTFGKNFTEQKVFNNVWSFLKQSVTAGPESLRGRVDAEHVAVLGHSFGGTVAMNLAQGECAFPSCMGNLEVPEELDAALFYGFNYTDRMTGEAKSMANQVPVLFIAGEFNDADKVADTYENAVNAPKVYVMVKGANHYGITNENNPGDAKPDTDAPTVAQDEAIAAIADWSGVFLRAYLAHDQAAGDYLRRLGDGEDERVEVRGEF